MGIVSEVLRTTRVYAVPKTQHTGDIGVEFTDRGRIGASC